MRRIDNAEVTTGIQSSSEEGFSFLIKAGDVGEFATRCWATACACHRSFLKLRLERLVLIQSMPAGDNDHEEPYMAVTS